MTSSVRSISTGVNRYFIDYKHNWLDCWSKERVCSLD